MLSDKVDIILSKYLDCDRSQIKFKKYQNQVHRALKNHSFASTNENQVIYRCSAIIEKLRLNFQDQKAEMLEWLLDRLIVLNQAIDTTVSEIYKVD